MVNLSQPSLDTLALVHVTDVKPERTSSGFMIKSAFQGAGGFAQQADPDAIVTRQTVHFSLQGAVTDHAYGKFSGRSYVVVADARKAVETNGRPETLLASDVAFFPQDGVVHLPGASLIEFSASMPPGEFIKKSPDGLCVSRQLTEENRPQAIRWFEDLQAAGHEVSPYLKKLESRSPFSQAEITALGVASALSGMGKPTMSCLTGSAAMLDEQGFDGWMSQPALNSVAQEIDDLAPSSSSSSSSSSGMNKTGCSRHDGSAGDRLATAVRLTCTQRIEEIANNSDTPARISSAAQTWLGSNLFRSMRERAVLSEIQTGAGVRVGSTGVEDSGIVEALYAKGSTGAFVHPTMGLISRAETDQVLLHLDGSHRANLAQALQLRSDAGEQGGYEMGRLANRILSGLTSDTLPDPEGPAPAVGVSGDSIISAMPPPPVPFRFSSSADAIRLVVPPVFARQASPAKARPEQTVPERHRYR